jgi:hypothetical protein
MATFHKVAIAIRPEWFELSCSPFSNGLEICHDVGENVTNGWSKQSQNNDYDNGNQN